MTSESKNPNRTDESQVVGKGEPLEGTIGPSAPQDRDPNNGNVSVQALIGKFHFAPDNAAALARIAQIDPTLAHKMLEASESDAQVEYKRYKVGATAGTFIVVPMMGIAGLLIWSAGILAGVVFCLLCIVVLALMNGVVNGVTQDVSWIGKILNKLGLS